MAHKFPADGKAVDGGGIDGGINRPRGHHGPDVILEVRLHVFPPPFIEVGLEHGFDRLIPPLAQRRGGALPQGGIGFRQEGRQGFHVVVGQIIDDAQEILAMPPRRDWGSSNICQSWRNSSGEPCSNARRAKRQASGALNLRRSCAVSTLPIGPMRGSR